MELCLGEIFTNVWRTRVCDDNSSRPDCAFKHFPTRGIIEVPESASGDIFWMKLKVDKKVFCLGCPFPTRQAESGRLTPFWSMPSK